MAPKGVDRERVPFDRFFGRLLREWRGNVSATEREINRVSTLLNQTPRMKMQYENGKRYLFIGCGSSYNLGYIVSSTLNRHNIPSFVRSAGSILAANNLPELNLETDVAILISRTGESTETVRVLKQLREIGIQTVGVTCQKDSSIVRNSDRALLYDFAYEESVVMTGSFPAILDSLLGPFQPANLSERATAVLESSKRVIARLDLKRLNHFVFLGFNALLGLSKEGALKLQEMALESVDYQEPLEYRHGPKSTLTASSLVLVQSYGTDYERDLVAELKGYGAEVIVVGNTGDIDVGTSENDELPLRILPVLWLGYQKALSKGLDPDRPKNLSKTVVI